MAFTERYVRADAAGSGDGTTDTNSGANGAWTLAEAITNAAAGMRLNVRAGTFASTTTARTFAGAGTTTAPIWWRGFTSTAGDLDATPTSSRTPGTDMPEFTWTTAGGTVTGIHELFSNISFSGARTAGSQMICSATATVRFIRCRFINTGTNAASSAYASGGGASHSFVACYFSATSSATRVAEIHRTTEMTGCAFVGGGIGIDITGSGGSLVLDTCTFNNLGNHGINVGAACSFFTVDNCSFYSCGGDGIRFTALPSTTAPATVKNCIFSESGGYGINNASGADSNVVHRMRNLYHSNTSGTETGFGDSPTFNDQTDSSSPFTNGAGSDLTIVTGSNAKAKAAPNLFEGQTYSSFLDIGAVQREEPAGGGGQGISQGLHTIETGVCA